MNEHKDQYLKACSLSIIETALAWDLLLASYRQRTEIKILAFCTKTPEIMDVARARSKMLDEQIQDLETIIKQSGLPLPSATPDVKPVLITGDRAVVHSMVRLINLRIGVLGVSVKSIITSAPLRLLTAIFMTEEVKQLTECCRAYSRQLSPV